MNLSFAYLITFLAFRVAFSETSINNGKLQDRLDCDTTEGEVNINYTSSVGNVANAQRNTCRDLASLNSTEMTIDDGKKNVNGTSGNADDANDIKDKIINSGEESNVEEGTLSTLGQAEKLVNTSDNAEALNMRDGTVDAIGNNEFEFVNITLMNETLDNGSQPFQKSFTSTEPVEDGTNNYDKLNNLTYNNTYGNYSNLEDFLQEIREFIFPKTWTWVLIFFHSVVFVIGIMGNTLVCIAVYRNHTMRTVTNYFIVNLALADFLVIFVCLPPTVIWDVTMTWWFGVYMCKIVLYLQGVSVTVSVLTLTFISVDRWYAICFPLKFKSTTGRAKTAIGVIWLLALIFDIPELIVYRTVNRIPDVDTIYFTQCEPSWTIKTDTWWNILRTIFLYAVPLLFMTITYCQIIIVLWRSGNTNQHGVDIAGNRQVYTFSMNTNTSTRGQLRSRKKAAKMLVAVVVMFALCYLPVHLMCVLRVTVGLSNSDANRAIFLISHWLCYANSAVNPIIYNFMSGKFRKEFRRAFDCCTSESNLPPGYELNSLHNKNTVRDSGNGNGTRSVSRNSKKNGTEIKRSETLMTDLKT